jgi:lysophospholipase L1-like esterase
MRASLHLRPAIVLFGDSLTQQGFGVDGKVGWASLLAAAYSRRADVLNRGFSGYNTNHAIDLLPKLFGSSPDNDILFCTVFFGANDAALVGEPQHVPMEQYTENLRTIVASIRERSQSSKSFPIIIMTPPPVDEEAWATWRNLAVCDRSNQAARAYGDQAKQVFCR